MIHRYVRCASGDDFDGPRGNIQPIMRIQMYSLVGHKHYQAFAQDSSVGNLEKAILNFSSSHLFCVEYLTHHGAEDKHDARENPNG